MVKNVKVMKPSSSKLRDNVQESLDVTVLVYHDIRLKQSDVENLRGPFWLSDQIIAFYFEYLANVIYQRYSDKFCFVSPQITQLIKLHSPKDSCLFLDPQKPENKQIIFFAVNNNESDRAGGTHWSLLVFSRQEECFYSFDSLKNFNASATKKIVRVLKVALQFPYADLYEHEAATQQNGHDCGIHLLANTENICDHYLAQGVVSHVQRLEASAVDNKRHEILCLIKVLGGKIDFETT